MVTIFAAKHLNDMKTAALAADDPAAHAASLVVKDEHGRITGHVASAVHEAEHNRIRVTIADGTGFPLPVRA